MILDKKEFKDGLENLKKNKRVEEHILMYDVYLATKPTQIGTTVLHLLAEVNQLIPSVSLSKSLSNKHLVLHKYELLSLLEKGSAVLFLLAEIDQLIPGVSLSKSSN